MNKSLLRSLALSTAAAAVMAVLGAGSASAAAPMPGAYDWTGFYAGANLGGAWAFSNWSDINVPSDSEQNLPGQFASNHSSGIIGGIQGGYNFQTGGFVFGLEGSVSGADLSGGGACFGQFGDYTAQCTTKFSWLADLTAHLGYTPIDRLLFFVKGGIAYTNGEYTPANEHGPYSPTAGYGSTSEDRWGSVFGLGIQYALMEHWILGAEYDHYDFGTRSVNFSPNSPINDYNPPFGATVADQINKAIVTVSYKF